MTLFTDYLDAVRAYEKARETPGADAAGTPVHKLAWEAEDAFEKVVAQKVNEGFRRGMTG